MLIAVPEALEDRNLGPAGLATYLYLHLVPTRSGLLQVQVNSGCQNFRQAMVAGLATALHGIGWGQLLSTAALRMWSMLGLGHSSQLCHGP